MNISKPSRVTSIHLQDGALEVSMVRLDMEPNFGRSPETYLSAAERQRASRFVRESDCRRFIVGRAWLRTLLSQRLDVAPASIEFVYGKHGKPALALQFAESGWRFNISHSGGVAVYGFSFEREIGIDLETIRPIPDADDIATRLFSRRENTAYRSLSPPERQLGFFNCWTRKEAFVKAIGDGLAFPLDHFDVSLTPGEPAEIIRIEYANTLACDWHMDTFSPDQDLLVSFVIEKSRDELFFPAPSGRSGGT